MRFKYKVFFASIISIMAIYIVFATCIDFFCFNRSFYKMEYASLNTAQHLGMSETGLYDATDTLLDYLQDYRDDIVVKVEVNDVEREVFDERETMHMVDVKNLYLNVMLIRNILFFVMIGLILFLYYDKKKELKEVLTYAYIRVFILTLFALCALLVYAYSDFTTFWTNFHKIFFTNDLWLLDPNTSIMINMFPETFFNHMVFGIAISIIVVLVATFIYSLRYQKKLMKSVKMEANS